MKKEQKIIKSYRIYPSHLLEEDGHILKLPEGAIYRSVEGKTETKYDHYDNGHEYKDSHVLLWMEIDESNALIERRFKADCDMPGKGMVIEDYMEFIGPFTIIDYHSTTYHLYELMMDPKDIEQGWRKVKSEDIWKMGEYTLRINKETSFGTFYGWTVSIHDNYKQRWNILEYTKPKKKLVKIAKYIRDNYKSRNTVDEFLGKKELDLKMLI